MSEKGFGGGALILTCIVSLIIGIFIGEFLFSQWDNYGEIKELGQSICEEEYDMDFKDYNDEGLKCKPKEIKNETFYDGIIVQIS